MYEFTNGIVVFDEKTRDKMLSAGYKLVKEQKVEEESSETSETEEENNENNSDNGTIEEKPRGSKKISK